MFIALRPRLALAAALNILMLTLACGSSTVTQPSPTVPFSATDLVVGTGATASATSIITVKYTGWVYDSSKPDNKGTQFDTNTAGFTRALQGLIPGWVQGVPGMKVGGMRRLVIPPSLAYGNQPVDIIPANSTLVFDIELLGVQ